MDYSKKVGFDDELDLDQIEKTLKSCSEDVKNPFFIIKGCVKSKKSVEEELQNALGKVTEVERRLQAVVTIAEMLLKNNRDLTIRLEFYHNSVDSDRVQTEATFDTPSSDKFTSIVYGSPEKTQKTTKTKSVYGKNEKHEKTIQEYEAKIENISGKD